MSDRPRSQLMLMGLRSRVPGRAPDAGTTLVEVMVVVAMIGVLTAFAVWGIRGWATTSAHKGTAQQIQSVLRVTHERAITEGQSFCVEFNTTTNKYAVFTLACTDAPCTEATRVKTSGWFGTESGQVHLVGPGFVDASNTSRARVSFSPRGSAWPGQVVVERDGSDVEYVVRVEGMTGRVSLG